MATREQIEAAWNVYDSVSVTPERPIEYKIGLMIDAAMRVPIAAGSGPELALEDISEMLRCARAAQASGFKSVQIDAAHVISVLELAWQYKDMADS